MAGEWFETVLEAQRQAKKRLPKSVYMALVAGSEKGVTLDDNVNAFSELGFSPLVAGMVSLLCRQGWRQRLHKVSLHRAAASRYRRHAPGAGWFQHRLPRGGRRGRRL